jgi:hypothetical protein
MIFIEVLVAGKQEQQEAAKEHFKQGDRREHSAA